MLPMFCQIMMGRDNFVREVEETKKLNLKSANKNNSQRERNQGHLGQSRIVLERNLTWIEAFKNWNKSMET